MPSKVGLYRVRAEECCLNAMKVEDNSRRIHWLEAAARWVALGRQEVALLTVANNVETNTHADEHGTGTR